MYFITNIKITAFFLQRLVCRHCCHYCYYWYCCWFCVWLHKKNFGIFALNLCIYAFNFETNLLFFSAWTATIVRKSSSTQLCIARISRSAFCAVNIAGAQLDFQVSTTDSARIEKAFQPNWIVSIKSTILSNQDCGSKHPIRLECVKDRGRMMLSPLSLVSILWHFTAECIFAGSAMIRFCSVAAKQCIFVFCWLRQNRFFVELMCLLVIVIIQLSTSTSTS